MLVLSPLLWGRGLKFPLGDKAISMQQVAPFVGAWIEIAYMLSDDVSSFVAPFVGAWIEI